MSNPSRRRHRKATSGWVPNQHGAWAMITVPWVLGTWLRFAQDRPAAYALVLGAFWLAGYFTFHAASLWLKSHRQPRYRTPVLVYGGLAAALGLATWWLGGAALAWWALPFLPVLGIAFALAASRHERALVGGLLTVGAACLVVLVAAYESPALLASEPGARAAIGLALACFGYFGGTVFFVKSMIRERGNAAFLAASVGWHVAVLAGAVVAALTAGASWAWAVFFAVVLARTVAFPLVGPMREHGRRFTPKQLGIVEIFFTLALVAIAVTTT